MSSSLASAPAKKELGFVEFVCLIALMMALNALAIDSMLPALPHIGADLKIPVLAYVAVLATMAALALARAWTPAIAQALPRSARFAAAGGLAFVLSDSLLAWDKFGGGLPLAQPLILATYWFAQACIARSVAAR